MEVLFLIGCAFAALSTFAVLAWSPRPDSIWLHVRGGARLGVMASSILSAAGAKEGWTPPWESVLFVWTVGLAYAMQAFTEARRQRDESAGAPGVPPGVAR